LAGASILEIICPRCGKSLPFAAEIAGRELFCLGCGAQFLVPAENVAPSESSHARLEKVQILDVSPAADKDARKGEDRFGQPQS
jgi:uncharacterized Zn finger protein (UPF0148 family)